MLELRILWAIYQFSNEIVSLFRKESAPRQVAVRTSCTSHAAWFKPVVRPVYTPEPDFPRSGQLWASSSVIQPPVRASISTSDNRDIQHTLFCLNFPDWNTYIHRRPPFQTWTVQTIAYSASRSQNGSTTQPCATPASTQQAHW